MAKTEKVRKDPRVELITNIWGIVVGIAGVSIPITIFAGEEAIILPILAIIGATITSSIVWFTKGHAPAVDTTLQESVARMEQRMAQLEIETRDIELRYAIEHSAQKQTPPTPPVTTQTL